VKGQREELEKYEDKTGQKEVREKKSHCIAKFLAHDQMTLVRHRVWKCLWAEKPGPRESLGQEL